MNSEPPLLLNDIAGLQCGSSLSSFDLYERLGRGAMGVVRLVSHKRTRSVLAMKYICRATMDESRIVEEINVHRTLKHPHVLRMKGFFFDDKFVYLLLQIARGSVQQELQEQGPLSDERAARVVAQMSMGIQYLHQNNIIHRDIKPDNLLFDYDKNVLVSDFGWSSRSKPGETRETVAGSPSYMAPEQTALSKYDNSVDVWSMGVVAYEVLAGQTPFDDAKSYSELGKNIRSGKFVIPPYFSVPAAEFVKGLIRVDPQSRMTLNQILKSNWLVKFVGVDGETGDDLFHEAATGEHGTKQEETVADKCKVERHKEAEKLYQIPIVMACGDQSVLANVNTVSEIFTELHNEWGILQHDIHVVTRNTAKIDWKKTFKGLCYEGDTLVFHRSGSAREIMLTKKTQKKSTTSSIFTHSSNGLGSFLVGKVKKSLLKEKDLPVPGEMITEINGSSTKGWSHEKINKVLAEVPENTPFTLKLTAVDSTKPNPALKLVLTEKRAKEESRLAFNMNGSIIRYRQSAKALEKLADQAEKFYGLVDHALAAALVNELRVCLRMEDARRVMAVKDLPELGEEDLKKLWKSAMKC